MLAIETNIHHVTEVHITPSETELNNDGSQGFHLVTIKVFTQQGKSLMLSLFGNNPIPLSLTLRNE